MLKAVSSITNAIGALNYKGTWNASTNTPTLADGTGAKGDYYVVSTAGTQTFDGILLFFGAGDWIVYNGAVWQRVEGGSDGNFSNVTLNSTDAGATAGPLLDLYRNSASPAASDTIGEIEFNGQDSAGNKQQYALIHGSILSPTSTTEQGQIHFETATAGASTEKMIIGTTNLVINEIGAIFNVRIEGDTDANLFYTDATNDRIGVGTITPTAKLQVYSTTSTVGNLLRGTGTTNGVDLQLNNSGGSLYVGVDNSTGSTTGTAYARFIYSSANNPLQFYVFDSLKATIDSSGNLLVGVATANANGGVLQLKSGITFPATAVAATDANTLDDYEEGTFTPTIIGTTSAGTASYSYNAGSYTKVGNIVTISFYIAWSGGTGTGDLRIEGLPFTTANSNNIGALSIGYITGLTLTALNYATSRVAINSTQIIFEQSPVGGGANSTIAYDAAAALVVSGSYFV